MKHKIKSICVDHENIEPDSAIITVDRELGPLLGLRPDQREFLATMLADQETNPNQLTPGPLPFYSEGSLGEFGLVHQSLGAMPYSPSIRISNLGGWGLLWVQIRRIKHAAEICPKERHGTDRLWRLIEEADARTKSKAQLNPAQ